MIRLMRLQPENQIVLYFEGVDEPQKGRRRKWKIFPMFRKNETTRIVPDRTLFPTGNPRIPVTHAVGVSIRNRMTTSGPDTENPTMTIPATFPSVTIPGTIALVPMKSTEFTTREFTTAAGMTATGVMDVTFRHRKTAIHELLHAGDAEDAVVPVTRMVSMVGVSVTEAMTEAVLGTGRRSVGRRIMMPAMTTTIGTAIHTAIDMTVIKMAIFVQRNAVVSRPAAADANTAGIIGTAAITGTTAIVGGVMITIVAASE